MGGQKILEKIGRHMWMAPLYEDRRTCCSSKIILFASDANQSAGFLQRLISSYVISTQLSQISGVCTFNFHSLFFFSSFFSLIFVSKPKGLLFVLLGIRCVCRCLL